MNKFTQFYLTKLAGPPIDFNKIDPYADLHPALREYNDILTKQVADRERINKMQRQAIDQAAYNIAYPGAGSDNPAPLSQNGIIGKYLPKFVHKVMGTKTPMAPVPIKVTPTSLENLDYGDKRVMDAFKENPVRQPTPKELETLHTPTYMREQRPLQYEWSDDIPAHIHGANLMQSRSYSRKPELRGSSDQQVPVVKPYDMQPEIPKSTKPLGTISITKSGSFTQFYLTKLAEAKEAKALEGTVLGIQRWRSAEIADPEAQF